MVAKVGSIISSTLLPKTGTTVVKRLQEGGKISKTVLFGEGNSIARTKGIQGFETYDGGLHYVFKDNNTYICNARRSKRDTNYVTKFLKSLGWIE